MCGPSCLHTPHQLQLSDAGIYDFFGVSAPYSTCDSTFASAPLLLQQSDSELPLIANLDDGRTTSLAPASQIFVRPGGKEQEPSHSHVFPDHLPSMYDRQDTDIGILFGGTAKDAVAFALPLPYLPPEALYLSPNMSYVVAERRLYCELPQEPASGSPTIGVTLIREPYTTSSASRLGSLTRSPSTSDPSVPKLRIRHGTAVPKCDRFGTHQVQPTPSVPAEATASSKSPLSPSYQFTFFLLVCRNLRNFPDSRLKTQCKSNAELQE